MEVSCAYADRNGSKGVGAERVGHAASNRLMGRRVTEFAGQAYSELALAAFTNSLHDVGRRVLDVSWNPIPSPTVDAPGSPTKTTHHDGIARRTVGHRIGNRDLPFLSMGALFQQEVHRQDEIILRPLNDRHTKQSVRGKPHDIIKTFCCNSIRSVGHENIDLTPSSGLRSWSHGQTQRLSDRGLWNWQRRRRAHAMNDAGCNWAKKHANRCKLEMGFVQPLNDLCGTAYK